MLTSYQIIGMHTLVKLEHEFHNKSNEYAKYKNAYNIACPLDLPQVDFEASERLAAAKLRGARSTGFACKNIHLIKILARKLIKLIYADISCLHNKPKLSVSAGC